MLQHVHIKNFTLIKNLDIECHAGLTVITGETGAGKSILIDAIEIALGQRSNPDLIRQGEQRAEITVTFDIARIPEAIAWLKHHELHHGEECIIRRTLHRDGRSRCYINDSPTTLQKIKELVILLINIHGQHEYQSLMQRGSQREVVDYFAGIQSHIPTLKALSSDIKSLQKKIESLTTSADESQAKQEYLRFQLQELAALDLQENEVEILNKEHKRHCHSELLQQHYQHIASTLSEDDPNVLLILHQLHDRAKNIEKITQEPSDLTILLAEATIQLEEASANAKHTLEYLERDPQRLHDIESRLGTIHDLARKHKVQPEALFDFTDHLQQTLQALENPDQNIEQLQNQKKESEAQYIRLAEKVSLQRKKAITSLNQAITREIRHLAMPEGYFEAVILPEEKHAFMPYGLENIEFRISANPGNPPQAIQKIASGGELSRISLAIHVVTCQHLPAPTMVFDEVDVGIGGHTGDVVGNLLRSLGESGQTLCITHLPQVAAKGHHHILVRKQFANNETTTKVDYINGKVREEEIARMLGGSVSTSIAHAKEMLK